MRSSNDSLHPVAVPVMGIVSGMRDAVIAGGARTAVGRLLGSLKDFTAADLGGLVIRAALERAGAPAERVDYVIMGQVLQAGAGQNPSRQAAVAGGIPMTVPSLTVNKVCLSGLDAIALAAQLIRAGEFDVVVAGGMVSMTCRWASPPSATTCGWASAASSRMSSRPGRTNGRPRRSRTGCWPRRSWR